MSLLLDARKKINHAPHHGNVQTGMLSMGELKLEDSLTHSAPETPEVKNDHHHAATPRTAGQNLFAAKTMPTVRRLGIIPVALFIGLVFAAGGGYYVWSETFPPPLIQRQNLVLPPAAEAVIETATPLVAAPAPLPVAPLREDSPAAPDGHGKYAAPDNAVVLAGILPLGNNSQTRYARFPLPSPLPKGEGDKVSLREFHVKKQDVAKNSSPTSAPTPPSEPAEHILQDTPANLVQPIRINHGKEDDAVDPALLAAWQAYHNGDLRAAWQQYSAILHRDARSRDALLGLAAIAQQQSQDSIAAHYYRQVLALDPRDPVAHAGMYSLLGTGNGADSESRLKLLLVQHPEAAPLHFVLGNHYAQQSRWSEAQQAYFRACDLESGNARFAFNLAVSLDHIGQGKLAAQHYRRALELDSAGNASFDRAQTQSRLDELTH